MTEPAPFLVHLVAGSTGAGKTTLALRLAEELGAVRFSIDEWTTGLYGPDIPSSGTYPWLMERIGRIEARLWAVTRQLAALGVPVVLDLGFTKADHRAKFETLAHEAELPLRLHFADVPACERWTRVQRRNHEGGPSFHMAVTREMFDFMESIWEPPTEAELFRMNGLRDGA